MAVYPERPSVSARPEATAEPSRAQQRLLGLVGPRRARTDEENEELSQVILTPAAWSTLRPTLYAPGRLSGGVLYGHRIDGVLHVQLVAPGGYPWWLSAPDPLDLDPHYTLGWSDCLRAQYADAIDWAGQWIMYPDRSLAAVATDHDWMLRGAPNRLIDHEHPLLVIGYIEGVLRVRAYRYEFGSLDITPLRVVEARDTKVTEPQDV